VVSVNEIVSPWITLRCTGRGGRNYFTNDFLNGKLIPEVDDTCKKIQFKFTLIGGTNCPHDLETFMNRVNLVL
jgi:hypothetical protein